MLPFSVSLLSLGACHLHDNTEARRVLSVKNDRLIIKGQKYFERQKPLERQVEYFQQKRKSVVGSNKT